MRRRPGLLLAAVLVAVTALGACADDGGDEAGPDASAGGTARSTTTSIVFTGDPASAFCGLLRDVEVQAVLDEEAASPVEVEAAFATVLEALGRVAEAAPPELAEDTGLVLAGMLALDDALGAVGYRYDALAADPAAAVAVSRAANDPAFAVASARIEAYEEQVCGL